MFKGDDEMKKNKWSELGYLICILLVIFVFTIMSYSLFDLFGNSKDNNQVVIFGGFLGLLGGITGAFSAYFIARMQMTKQLDLQFEKEKDKLVLELEIENGKRKIQLINNLMYQSESLKYLILDLQNMFCKINKLGEETKKYEQKIQNFLNAIKISKKNNENIYAENYQSVYKELDSMKEFSIEEYNKKVSEFNQTFMNGKEILKEIQRDLSEYLTLELIHEKDTVFFDKHKDLIPKVVKDYSKEIDEQSIKNLSEKVSEIDNLINYQAQVLEKQTKEFKDNIKKYQNEIFNI